jgi:hypothetical protein
VLLAACGPHVHPEANEPDSDAPAVVAPKHPTASPARNVLVGEMCPEGADGRPGVAPLFLRSVGWSADADDVGDALERSAHAFAVLGVDGTRAGVFEVLGATDVGGDADVAIGSYSGRTPCAPKSDDGTALADDACTAATSGCAVAVASLDDASGDDEAPDVSTGGACVSGDAIQVDIDGDGAMESFPLAGFIDSVRAPAEEVLAAPQVGASCTPTFAVYGLAIVPEPEDPSAPDDPRYHVNIDLDGVVDLDGDGRQELIVSYRYEEGRTVVIYSAQQQAGRLELVGEAVPWQ